MKNIINSVYAAIGVIVAIAILLISGQYLIGMYKTGPAINSNTDYVINKNINIKGDLSVPVNIRQDDNGKITVVYPELWPVECFAAANVVKMHVAEENMVTENCSDWFKNNSITVTISLSKLEPTE